MRYLLAQISARALLFIGYHFAQTPRKTAGDLQ
jgi:hypothetical protein